MVTRSEFIGVSSLVAVAANPAAASAAPHRSFAFNRTAFDAILAKPSKHKQCFGATRLDGAEVTYAMQNSIDAYEKFLGEGRGAMHAVAVLYHGSAIALALDNAVWNEIIVPWLPHDSEMQLAIPEARKGKGNPFLKHEFAKAVAQGCSFFVCHNAIQGFAESAAGILKESTPAVHAAIMAGVLPGALVVPAGVMAIDACQEAKFTYIQSSLG